MDEPMKELPIWTDEREMALKEVVVEQVYETDTGDVSPEVLEKNQEKGTRKY